MPLSRLLVILLLAVGGLGLAGGTALATCTSCTCNLFNSPVGLGSYDPLATTPDDSTGTIKILCTGDPRNSQTVSYEVRLSAGSGSFTQRTMRSGSGQLAYNLYTDSTHTTVWGDGSGGTAAVSRTFTLTNSDNRTYTVYARIPARQDPNPGGYTDSITVTLVY